MTEIGHSGNDDRTGANLILRRLYAGKWIIIASAALMLAAATFYLHGATRLYTAELKITPAPSSQLGRSGKLGNLGGLASLAGLAGGPKDTATPFDLYLDAISSRDVAANLANDASLMRKIFAGEWDADDQRWREPTSLRKSVTAAIYDGLGVFRAPWKAPDTDRLREYLASAIVIDQGINQPITRLRYSHPDPDFAVELLSRVNRIADRKVRQTSLAQATAYSRYLSDRLQRVRLAENREALAEVLAEQEQSIMLASSNTPYSAIPVDPPLVGSQPTSPRSLSIIVAAIVVGLMIGVLLALADPRRFFSPLARSMQ